MGVWDPKGQSEAHTEPQASRRGTARVALHLSILHGGNTARGRSIPTERSICLRVAAYCPPRGRPHRNTNEEGHADRRASSESAPKFLPFRTFTENHTHTRIQNNNS